MCGLAGYFDRGGPHRLDKDILQRMAATIAHRGPDSFGMFVNDQIGLAFHRLSIVDLESGDQPLYNEDKSLILVCNGEIFNHREIRRDLVAKGHKFATNTDVEVLLHLYEEVGINLLDKLNGQFAFVLYDIKDRSLLVARDHFGINPLFYTCVDGLFIFASEIKALLEHPAVQREVDLTGLDQLLSFPGLVSPRTMFKNIHSLKSGHALIVQSGHIQTVEYWDIVYPIIDDSSDDKPESYYIEGLKELLEQSVRYRLQADIPVGLYLSGGIDSSIIAAIAQKIAPHINRHLFSISFPDKSISESPYQQLMARNLNGIHHEISVTLPDIADKLSSMIYYCETPVKESFNTCALLLSQTAKQQGIQVVLAGQGADELFAGYVGYRFDQFRQLLSPEYTLDEILEEEVRQKLWGDKHLFYEKKQYAFRELKIALYSSALRECYNEFDSLQFELVNKERLANRSYIHQRSYLDLKLRLTDHLLSGHGDRMAMANSVEARYPFLDIALVDFARTIPPHLKLNQYTEKYILKAIASMMIPPEIVNREKFGFRGPTSSFLLQLNREWINDMLSYTRIKRQGYFDPEVVEQMRLRHLNEDMELNPHNETDFLMFVLTFGIFLDSFAMPSIG